MSYEGPLHLGTSKPGWNLWLLWIGATALPGTIALVLSDALVIGLPEYQISFSGDNGLAGLLGWLCGVIFIGGGLIGASQAFCLSKIANLTATAGLWTPLTVAGILLAVVVNVQANIMCFMGAGALLPGFVIGMLQWIALRSHGPRAAMWFLFSGLAWNLAFLAGFAVSNVFLTKDPEYGLPYYTLQSAVYWGVASSVALVIYGAITGFVLVWLLRTSGIRE